MNGKGFGNGDNEIVSDTEQHIRSMKYRVAKGVHY